MLITSCRGAALALILALSAGLLAQQADQQKQADQQQVQKRQQTQKPAGAEKQAPEKQAPEKQAPEKQAPEKVVRSKREWRELLTPAQFRVLRLKDTEPAFRNKYDKHFEPGTYACAGCDQELFTSTTKFNSGCGWPAFYAAKAGDRVILQPDYSHGMIRTEVLCAQCESHLGHVFQDAPLTPTGTRYCINSLALKFIPATQKKDAEEKRDKEDKANSDKASRPAEGQRRSAARRSGPRGASKP